MTMPGTLEILIVLAILTLLFGARRLPPLARGLGQAIRELRSATRGDGT